MVERFLEAMNARSLELLVGVGLTIQDMHVVDRAHAIRDGDMPRPVTGSLDEYFVYNSGNLFNGYYYALEADLILNLAIDRIYSLSTKVFGEASRATKFMDYLREDPNRINMTSGVASALAIGFFETTGICNTPDYKDIPAGVVGAMMHVGLRYMSLKRFNKNKAILTDSFNAKEYCSEGAQQL